MIAAEARGTDLQRGMHAGLPLAQALSPLPIGGVITDADQRILYVNDAFERMTGYSRDEVAGRNCRFLQGPDSDPLVLGAIRTALGAGAGFRGDLLNVRKDGDPFWNAMQIAPLEEDGTLVGYVALLEDVTGQHARHREAAELAESADALLATVSRLAAATDVDEVAETLTQAVVRAGAHGASVAIRDASGTLRVVSSRGWAREVIAAFRRMPDRARSLPELRDWDADPIARWVTIEDATPDTREVMAALAVDRFIAAPVVAADQSHGALLAYWARTGEPTVPTASLQDRLGRLGELGAIVLDNLQMVDRIRMFAAHDQLTGVATRSVVESRLTRALREDDHLAAVLYMDVDRFKRVNDTLGHGAADRLLQQLAERLKAVVGHAGTLGRPGGDEFVVVLTVAEHVRDARALSARIEDSMREPFVVDGRTVYASLSIGYELGGRGPHETAEDAAARLLRSADLAMYSVKERKRTRSRVDTPFDVVLLEADLHRALELDEITTHFQAQFDGRTGRLTGFEALVRWQHRTFGQVPPDVFIPIAEETQVILDIGRRVLEDAFAFADRAVARFGPLHISVNVSKYQLLHHEFSRQVATMLAEHSERAWALTAEIPEPDLSDDEGLREVLDDLRTMDVDIAIDDFGSGFSSLKTLQTLPITSIKIDETFLRRTGALGGGMIAAVFSLGSGLGLEVMAEGLETHEQLEALRRLGCGRMQGYVMGGALPAAEALETPDTLDAALAGAS